MKSERNKTIQVSDEEIKILYNKIRNVEEGINSINSVYHGNFFDAYFTFNCDKVDLLILDPPYNLNKEFNGTSFKEMDREGYKTWFNEVIIRCLPILKESASVYVCSDWRTSTIIFDVLNKYFKVRNRITWEREKGRGSKNNWKNNTEDIWFCTVGDSYTFNYESVKIKKKVLAPYRDPSGKNKDWEENNGKNVRMTYPSNIWTDITIPFWSMPENTEHPTQKPEKLIAKLMMASTNEGDTVLDPFCGSGTSLVVAKKLGRNFIGVDIDKKYCCISAKRLEMCDFGDPIQGIKDGIFLDRNFNN